MPYSAENRINSREICNKVVKHMEGFPLWKHAAAAPGGDLLSQRKAFQLDSGSFGDVNDLGKLNFNLWLIFAHNTWKRNSNERQVLVQKIKNNTASILFETTLGSSNERGESFFLFSLWDDFVFPLLSLVLSQDAIPLEIMSKKQHKHNTAADMRHTGVQWSIGGLNSDLMRACRYIEPLLSHGFVVVLTAQESKKGARKNPSEGRQHVYKRLRSTSAKECREIPCLFQTRLKIERIDRKVGTPHPPPFLNFIF